LILKRFFRANWLAFYLLYTKQRLINNRLRVSFEKRQLFKNKKTKVVINMKNLSAEGMALIPVRKSIISQDNFTHFLLALKPTEGYIFDDGWLICRDDNLYSPNGFIVGYNEQEGTFTFKADDRISFCFFHSTEKASEVKEWVIANKNKEYELFRENCGNFFSGYVVSPSSETWKRFNDILPSFLGEIIDAPYKPWLVISKYNTRFDIVKARFADEAIMVAKQSGAYMDAIAQEIKTQKGKNNTDAHVLHTFQCPMLETGEF
jgi:hypothetical protein